MTRDQLRGKTWRRLYRDVFVHASVRLTHRVRLEAAQMAIPDGSVAIGLTAAWLHGVLDPDPERPVPLQFARSGGRSAPRLSGVRGARLTLDPADVVEIEGLLVTSADRTCFDLARVGSTVDGVVAVDAFLSAGLTTQDRLWRFCAERRRWPGSERLRQAVLLGSDRVKSPAESHLRMLLVLNGLPEPCVNIPLHGERGVFLGMPDLLYLKPLFGIEYDGSYHRDGKVRQADLIRENGLLVGGLPLLRYCSYHLGRGRQAVLDEVSAALGLPSPTDARVLGLKRPR